MGDCSFVLFYQICDRLLVRSKIEFVPIGKIGTSGNDVKTSGSDFAFIFSKELEETSEKHIRKIFEFTLTSTSLVPSLKSFPLVRPGKCYRITVTGKTRKKTCFSNVCISDNC